jgi:membrane protease YdiL (CAAX protease family)
VVRTVLISVFCGLILLLFFGISEFLGAYYFAWGYGLLRWDLLMLTIPLLSIILLLFNAIPEEFIFRTLLQTSLVERVGRQGGIILTSVFFGFLHVPAILPYVYVSIGFGSVEFAAALMIAFLFQTQAGIVFGIAYDRTRNILLPVSLHLVYNLVLLTPVFWMQLTLLI